MNLVSIGRLFCMCVALATFGCVGDSDGMPSGLSDGSAPGPAGSGCPLTLTVDGATYRAVSCNVQGARNFARFYQVQISASFNTITGTGSGNIRSVAFVLDDDDAATTTHVGTFPVSTDRPGVKATYRATQLDSWGTLSGLVNVGSGSFVVTEYDRVNKVISATYDIVVKQGAASKTITGSLSRVPMARAE